MVPFNLELSRLLFRRTSGASFETYAAVFGYGCERCSPNDVQITGCHRGSFAFQIIRFIPSVCLPYLRYYGRYYVYVGDCSNADLIKHAIDRETRNEGKKIYI